MQKQPFPRVKRQRPLDAHYINKFEFGVKIFVIFVHNVPQITVKISLYFQKQLAHFYAFRIRETFKAYKFK